MARRPDRPFMARLKTEMLHESALIATKTITNTTTETEILASRYLRKNDAWKGFNFEVKMSGTLTTHTAAGGNDLDIAIRYGSTDIAQFEANGLGTNAAEIPWELHFEGRFTPGATDKIMGTGFMRVGESTIKDISATTNLAGATVDFNTLSPLNVTGQWGTANAANDLNVLAGWIKVHLATAQS